MVLSFSGAPLNDDTSILKIFFGVILVIIVVDSTGGGRGACWRMSGHGWACETSRVASYCV